MSRELEMGVRLVAESLHWTRGQHLRRVRDLAEQAEELDERGAAAADDQTQAMLNLVSANAYWSTTFHKQAAELLRERKVGSLAEVGPLELVERLLVERTQAHRRARPAGA
jgi:hypothetical protein